MPPIKDIGFPYRSSPPVPRGRRPARRRAAAAQLAALRDRTRRVRALGQLAARRRSSTAITATYLGWVLERATEGRDDDPRPGRRGRASTPTASSWGSRCEGEATTPTRVRLARARPAPHRARASTAPSRTTRRAEPRVLHCDSRRGEFARLPADREIEWRSSAAARARSRALVFLRACGREARITVYTPTLPLSRGESFLENRVFADPDDVGWERLDLQTRRDFVKHCDRGVFDAGVIASMAGDSAVRASSSAAPSTSAPPRTGRGSTLESRPPTGPSPSPPRLRRQLHRLRPPGAAARPLRRAGAGRGRAPGRARSGTARRGPKSRFGRSLALAGMEPRLHIPGLAGLSQGPGFANLGSLGLLANRVLQPLLPGLGDGGEGPDSQRKSVLID